MVYALNLFEAISRNISHRARYFLLRLCHECGADQSVPRKVKELAEAFGLSDRVVSQSIQELTEAGLLVAERTSRTPGRPTYAYRLADHLHQHVHKGEQKCIGRLAPCDRARIGAVLELSFLGGLDADIDSLTDGRPCAPNPVDRLNFSGRLILVILLSSADACGVVTGLSLGAIGRYSGMSRPRVRRQILKLWRLGYIRDVVPGVTGRGVLGKAAGIYFLNLEHTAFGSATWQGASLVIAIERSQELPANFKDQEMWQLLKGQTGQGEGALSLICEVDLRYRLFDVKDGPALAFLGGTNAADIAGYLQARFEQEVSSLLTRCWDSLMRERWGPPPENHASNDSWLWPQGEPPAQPDLDPAEEHHRATIDDLLKHLAWHKAAVIRGILGNRFGEATYALLPNQGQSGRGYLCLLRAARRNSGAVKDGGSVYYARANSPRSPKFEKISLALKDKFGYGLMVHPSIGGGS